jgi:hypothetical protein
VVGACSILVAKPEVKRPLVCIAIEICEYVETGFKENGV